MTNPGFEPYDPFDQGFRALPVEISGRACCAPPHRRMRGGSRKILIQRLQPLLGGGAAHL
jgi:hypothetical protein